MFHHDRMNFTKSTQDLLLHHPVHANSFIALSVMLPLRCFFVCNVDSEEQKDRPGLLFYQYSFCFAISFLMFFFRRISLMRIQGNLKKNRLIIDFFLAVLKKKSMD